MAKHSVAGRMVGLFSACFCSKAAVFIVSNMLRLLFEAVPSVPRHILAPLFFSMLCLKVFPTKSFMLAIGLCTTLTPFFAIMPASFSSSQTQWAAIVLDESNPILSRYSIGLSPFFLMQSFTSCSVSETWICILIFFFSENSAAHLNDSYDNVYME